VKTSVNYRTSAFTITVVERSMVIVINDGVKAAKFATADFPTVGWDVGCTLVSKYDSRFPAKGPWISYGAVGKTFTMNLCAMKVVEAGKTVKIPATAGDKLDIYIRVATLPLLSPYLPCA
jgi:hypothetical protein